MWHQKILNYVPCIVFLCASSGLYDLAPYKMYKSNVFPTQIMTISEFYDIRRRNEHITKFKMVGNCS